MLSSVLIALTSYDFRGEQKYPCRSSNCVPYAQALAAALANDPFYQALVPEANLSARSQHDLLCAYFEYSLREGEELGTVVYPEDGAYGAAVWIFSHTSRQAQRAHEDKQIFLANLLGKQGYEQYQAIITFMAAQAAPVIPSSAWYLSIIGIMPEQQGQRRGERLMQPTLAQADALGQTCYLETFGERSREFYKKFGFRDVLSPIEPVTNARYWLMLRAPQERNSPE